MQGRFVREGFDKDGTHFTEYSDDLRGWARITDDQIVTGCVGISADSARYVTSTGVALPWGLITASSSAPPVLHTDAILKAAVAAARDEERSRIRKALEAMKPGEQPYTRKSWNDERIGELRMWERMAGAIDKMAKESGE